MIGRGLAPWVVAFCVVSLVVPSLGPLPDRLASPTHREARAADSHPLGHEIPSTMRVSPRPTLAGGSGELLVTPTDPGIVPATGVEANFTAYDPVPLPSNSSFQVSVSVVLGAYVAVFGIFETNLLAPTAFLAVFANGTARTLALRYWPQLGLTPGEEYGFAIRTGSGTNWTLTVNGALFGGSSSAATFDYRLTELRWARAPSFSEEIEFTASSFIPPTVSIPLSMAFLQGRVWILPNRAILNSSPTPGGMWGIEGRTQNQTLAPGELENGPGLGLPKNGTPLWTGGPVPVRLTLSLTPSSASAFFPVVARAKLTDGNGSPLADVPIQFSDAWGSPFSAPISFTAMDGSAQASLLAPNSSVPDTVTASSAILGFVGMASAPLNSTQATQLQVAAIYPPGPYREGSQFGLTFRVTNLSGGPVDRILLRFAAGGGGQVSPPSAVTGADGMASTVVSLPSLVGTIEVIATVQAVGFWGHDTASVSVEPANQPWWAVLLPWIPWIVVGGLVAVLLAVVMIRGRPLQELPPLPLDSPGSAPPPAQP